MKKLLFVLTALFLMQYQIIASEQFNSLSVSLKNGQIVEFLLDDMPVVKFDKDKMIVKSLLIQSEFPKENIKRIFVFNLFKSK